MAARDIAWDLSGGRSGNRLGFFRWPLGRVPSIFGIALGVSKHVPRHFPFKIPGDLDIRSKAMEQHVAANDVSISVFCVLRFVLFGFWGSKGPGYRD